MAEFIDEQGLKAIKAYYDRKIGNPAIATNLEDKSDIWSAINEAAGKGGGGGDPELMEVLKQSLLKTIDDLENVYGAGGEWALSADAEDRATITYESLERIKALVRGINTSMIDITTVLKALNIGYSGEKLENFDDLIKKVPAINIQALALRTPGGHELIKGDWSCGFFGEVTAEEFGAFDGGSQAGKLLTPETYAAQVELTDGIHQRDFNDKMVFLKVALDGEIIYVSKYPVRYLMSWLSLANANIVFGRRVESIGGANYRLTIPRGLNVEYVSYDEKDDALNTSPYNRVFVDLLEDQYTAADLGLNHPSRYYCETWCQETITSTNRSNSEGQHRILRGNKGKIAYFTYEKADSRSSRYGLRPVLRYVP